MRAVPILRLAIFHSVWMSFRSVVLAFVGTHTVRFGHNDFVQTTLEQQQHHVLLTKRFVSKTQGDDVEDDDDDYDEVQQEAYCNRSLEWTHKYRSVIPYEKARLSVRDLGLRSKDEWDEYVADGKVYHGPYLPNHPDEMYREEWVSWEEFLGLTRSHDETRHIVQNVLQLKDMAAYERFVAHDTKRAEGLRIPAKPAIVYKNKGWISTEHFFGQTK